MILLAPFLTLAAMVIGGLATIVATILNGPRRFRRRADPPIVLLPPVPSPDMRRLIEEEEREHSLAL